MPEKTCASLFQSCEETANPETVQINGSIPPWLNGSFIRTGPAKWDFPGFTMNHWLDGYALLTKFSINGSGSGSGGALQTVTLQQKFLNSDAYVRGCCANKTVITEFGTRAYPDPQKSFLSRIICAVLPIELSDNGNLNVFALGSELFASSETCYFRDVNPQSLDSKEKYDTNKYFGVNIASAHPLTDSETGITYNLGSNVLTGLKYTIIKIPPPDPDSGPNSRGGAKESAKDLMKKSKILCSIPSSWIGMMSYFHSFGMTANYLIFIEQPYVMNIAKAAKTIFKGSPVFKDFCEWRPELRNRFHVIEKETGNAIKTEYFAQDSFFYLHIINAYEENGQLVVDLMSYKNADFMDATYLAPLREGRINELAFQASVHRYVLPIITNTNTNFAVVPENANLVEVKSHATARRATTGNDKSIILTPEVLSGPGLENPALNKKSMGKKYAYFYAPGTPGQHQYSNSIAKFDLRKKTCTCWVGDSEDQLPGEPQFIPNPEATQTQEDDGVLVSIVSDLNPSKSTFMLFLDAKTMMEIGRAQFQRHLPLALHGIYLPAAAETETEGDAETRPASS